MIEEIQNLACEIYSITLSELKGKKRDRRLIIPRYISMLACKDLSNITLVEIAKEYERDHSTIIHAINTMRGEMKFNKILEKEYESFLSSARDITACPLKTNIDSLIEKEAESVQTLENEFNKWIVNLIQNGMRVNLC